MNNNKNELRKRFVQKIAADEHGRLCETGNVIVNVIVKKKSADGK